MYVPLVGRVADLIEGSNKLIKLVLLEANAHVEGVVRGRRRVELPSTGHLRPGVLHLEVIPTLDEGLGGDELDEPEKDGGRPEHGDGSLPT